MSRDQWEVLIDLSKSSVSHMQWQALNDLANQGRKFPSEFQPKKINDTIELSSAFKVLLQKNSISEDKGRELCRQMYRNQSSVMERTKNVLNDIGFILNNTETNDSMDLSGLEACWKGLVSLSDRGSIPGTLHQYVNGKSVYSEGLLCLAARLQKSKEDIDELLSNNAKRKEVRKYIDSLIYWRATGMRHAPEKPIINTQLTELAYMLAFQNYSDYIWPSIEIKKFYRLV